MGHRADVAERAAEGHDPVALLEVVAVAPLGGDEAVGLDLDDGEVGLRIGAEDLAVVDLAAVGERDAPSRSASPATWLLVRM